MSDLKSERDALRDALVSWSVEAAELKREVKWVEARVAKLEADPRMALTEGDLDGSIREAEDMSTYEHVCSHDGEVSPKTAARVHRLYLARDAARAALAAEKGDET